MRCTHFLGISSFFTRKYTSIQSLLLFCDDVVLNIHLYKEIMEREKEKEK